MPIDGAEQISGKLPWEIDQDRLEAKKVEQETVKTEKLGKTLEYVRNVISKIKEKYTGEDTAIFSPNEEAIASVEEFKAKKGELRLWTITREGKTITGVQIGPEVGGARASGFIALPDGTAYSIKNESRYGNLDLKIQGYLSTVSVPNSNGERFPLWNGAVQQYGQEFRLANDNSQYKERGLVGYGAALDTDQGLLSLEFWHVDSNSGVNDKVFNSFHAS